MGVTRSDPLTGSRVRRVAAWRSDQDPDVRGDAARPRSGSSSPPAGPDHAQTRRASRPTAAIAAGSRGCAGRKWPCWSGSPASTTSGSSAATRPASRRASSTDRPRAAARRRRTGATCSTCSAPPAHPSAPAAARQRPTGPADRSSGCIDSMADRARGRAQRPTRRPRRQRPRPRPLRTVLRRLTEPPNNARFMFLDPRATTFCSVTGTTSPTTPSRCCGPRPAVTPTTVSSPTWSASCRPAATTSGSAGPPTTSASTAPASRAPPPPNRR